ncbi:MAG: amidohydrolase family protein [Clostridia bacterium]|nr:amidohydrolase family protein [Clostridia bacterium]
MINEKIIDSHLHIEAWKNDSGSFIDGFEEHREVSGLASMNICSVPSKYRILTNNIMLGFYKLAHPNTYIHGSVDHIVPPNRDDMPKDMDLVTQYKEIMELGFDGIKMLEGKPTYLKPLGGSLNTPSLDKLFSEMEKDGVHIVFHVNDPDEFWDKDRAPSWAFPDWFYGDGTYPSYEEIYSQVDKILSDHPNLKVTFAHFYFRSKEPQKLIELFEKYPEVCVDLTPGTEMYGAFEDARDYYKEFFKKYSERVMVGTDGTFPWPTKGHAWCIDVLYRYLATDEAIMAFNDRILTGINLPKEHKENILYKNFERRVGDKPRAINKAKFKAYIDKYKHLLENDSLKEIEPLYNKYL